MGQSPGEHRVGNVSSWRTKGDGGKETQQDVQVGGFVAACIAVSHGSCRASIGVDEVKKGRGETGKEAQKQAQDSGLVVA